ncbi:Protein/nucleic acid deglycase DJ-1, partial [Sarcoptes scabiei]
RMRTAPVLRKAFIPIKFTSKFICYIVKDMTLRRALVVLTEGAEEMELVITVDVLRRAGIDTTIAGLYTEDLIKCSRNVVIKPDINLTFIRPDDYDAIILPGGAKAASTFSQDQTVGYLLKEFESKNKVIAVICASPIALEKHNVAIGRRVTSHPSVAEKLNKRFKYSEERVVNDNGLITSRGPGSAFEFALEIIRHLIGDFKVKEVEPSMMLPTN